ncbi:hypothetical protein OGAPHI_002043 [Ogataea philodendri]|uniref:Uncharacterized protein n=1 Tax=Ogataea philodendri TaxID=1378263 RepID=A0A9P8PB89_9ASCO|nr:uncharacterized protein OGAPHI_002043 [Ogataea philodendri]KAH3668289.1 hypothetical protein OGAPHI_002043 [Ogataea philodendri]
MNSLSNAAASAALRKHSSTSNLADRRLSGQRTMSLSSRSFRSPDTYSRRTNSLQNGSYNPYNYRSNSLSSTSYRPNNTRSNSLNSNSSRFSTGFTTTTTTTTKRLPQGRHSMPTTIVKTTKEQDAEGRTRSITKTTVEQKDGFEITKTTIVKPSFVENYGDDLGSIAEGFDEDFYQEEEPIANGNAELEKIQEEPVEPDVIHLVEHEPQPTKQAPATNSNTIESARTHTYRQLTQAKPKRVSVSPARIILKKSTVDDDSDGQSVYSDANEITPNTQKAVEGEKVTEEVQSNGSSTVAGSPVIPQRSSFRAPPSFAPRANSLTSNTSSMRKQVKIVGPDPAESRPAVRKPTPEQTYEQAYQIALQKVYGPSYNAPVEDVDMDEDTKKNTLLNAADSENGRAMSLTRKPTSPVPQAPVDSSYQSNAAGVGFRTHTLRGEADSKEDKKLKAAQHKEEKKKLKELRKEQKSEVTKLNKQREIARKNVDDLNEKKRIFSFRKSKPQEVAPEAENSAITVTLPVEEDPAPPQEQKASKSTVGTKFKKFFNL